jgi:hypothetical protein
VEIDDDFSIDMEDDLSNQEVAELESHRKQMELNRLNKDIYGSNVGGVNVGPQESINDSFEESENV